MNATVMAKGLLSWIPGVPRSLFSRSSATATESASYCYGVWIKHLALLRANGMLAMPRTVLELGPGASIGAGIAALLSGAERYVAIDAVPHLRHEANLGVFRELVALFRARAPRPRAGFPPIDEHLDARLFPSSMLDEARLETALSPARLDRIEHAIRALASGAADPALRYYTWDNLEPVANASVDLLFSHVVLNQVNDLEGIYRDCRRMVWRGRWMSTQIDLTSLNIAR